MRRGVRNFKLLLRLSAQLKSMGKLIGKGVESGGGKKCEEWG